MDNNRQPDRGFIYYLNKKLVIFSLIIIIIMLIMALLISPLTKYLIQKNDEKYLGRQITLDWVIVNPFNGFIHCRNLKVFEYQSDSIFISVAGLSANFNLFKLFSKTVKVSHLTFNRPMVKIKRRTSDFNFNDFRKKFPRGRSSPAKIKKPLQFYFLDIEIEKGHFYYIDEVIPVNFSIKDVDIKSKDGWCWDRDSIYADVSFLSEIGTGGMKGSYGMNLYTLFYSLDIAVNTFDLNVLEQYMFKISNYGSFRANFDADIKASGYFRDAENINLKGTLAINDFHFGINPEEDYVAFDSIIFSMDDVNPNDQRYFIDSLLLFNPYFRYERYDYETDNLQTMFGKSGGKVTAALSDAAQFNLIFVIGKYIRKLAKNFLRSDFKINRLAVHKGIIKFNDYTLYEKFALEFNPVTVSADSIDKQRNRVNISLESPLEPYGNLSVFLSLNPKDTGDYDLEYNIQKIPVTLFNPYIITFTSFPLDRGTIELKGNWHVRDSKIQSVNHLVIIDPRVSKKIKNKDNGWLPMPLIMSLVRERGNIIDYEIPITGNFKDPEFHLHDVIMDLLTNIFVKPPSTPYLLQVKNAETEIEKSITMRWNMRQVTLSPPQEKFIEKVAGFLKKNPEATITVYPIVYEIKEKEHILFFEAKKRFFMLSNNINTLTFNEEDSDKVDKLSIRDSAFVRYLRAEVNDTLLFTLQEQCARLIDPAAIITEFNKMNKKREASFSGYFKEKDAQKRVVFASGENVIPYNGFSYYKIKYTGEIPESLMKAHRKMNDLNDEAPREKYSQKRKKSGGAL